MAGVPYPMGAIVSRKGVPEIVYRRLFETRRIVEPFGVHVAAVPAAVVVAESVREPLPAHLAVPEGAIEPGNKGWFTVYFGGERVRSVRGEAAARQLLAELRGEAAVSSGSPDGEREDMDEASEETSGMDDTEMSADVGVGADEMAVA